MLASTPATSRPPAHCSLEWDEEARGCKLDKQGARHRLPRLLHLAEQGCLRQPLPRLLSFLLPLLELLLLLLLVS
jgi:hypothetical protein